MPLDAIDPSKVQWDPEPQSDPIDPTKVKWDAPQESVGRVTGLVGRALASGAAALPDEVLSLANPLATGIKLATGQRDAPRSNEPYKPQLSDFVHPERWQNAAEYFADKAHAPTPETPGERIGYRAAQALPSAALAPETPIAGALSSALGGAGSQVAAESGASPIGQTIAGLAAGSAPGLAASSGALVRRLVGGDSADVVQGRIAAAQRAGTTLNAGQATGSTALQYLAGGSGKLWGGGPISKLADKQTRDIGGNVGRIINNLSYGEPVNPTAAGSAILEGIGDARTEGTALGNMRQAEEAAYNKVDDLVAPDTRLDASGTLAALDKAASGVIPAPTIQQLRSNIRKRVTTKTTGFESVGNVAPPTPQLTYQDLRDIKTELGNSIDWGFAPADPVGNGKMKTLYGAVKNDIKTGVSGVSDEAAQAQAAADKLYGENEQIREGLRPIINKAGGPEAVYQFATNGTKLGATRINQVMSVINPDQQNIVRATVLDKLGHTNGATDRPFDASTFLKKWQNMDPSAKDALFGSSGSAGLRQDLDSLTDTIENIQKGTKLKNVSGSGEAVGHEAGLLAAWEALKHLLKGSVKGFASAGAAVLGNNILARALTNKRTVEWLSQTAKAPDSAIPNAVNQLYQMSDPDAKELASYLQQSSQQAPIARATGGQVSKPDMEALVTRLMNRWKAAKRATDETTKPLLKLPDAAIVRALDVAQEHI